MNIRVYVNSRIYNLGQYGNYILFLILFYQSASQDALELPDYVHEICIPKLLVFTFRSWKRYSALLGESLYQSSSTIMYDIFYYVVDIT